MAAVTDAELLGEPDDASTDWEGFPSSDSSASSIEQDLDASAVQEYLADDEDSSIRTTAYDYSNQNDVGNGDVSLNEARAPKWKKYLYATGAVRHNENGDLEWFDKRTKTWRRAVYHDQIRDQLIANANAFGTYKFKQPRGKFHANDVTAYWPDGKEWGTSRSNWPDIIFQYLRTEENTAPRSKPGFWTTKAGLLILDVKNSPLLNFNIPVAISSKVDSSWMEAWLRLDNALCIGDIRARMPRYPDGKVLPDGKDPLRQGSLSMRMTRFRNKAGCISWGPRAGSEAMKTYLDRLLPQACKDANSTRAFRDLRDYEVAEMKLINVTKFPHKARGGKAAAETTKTRHAAAYQKAQENYRRLKTTFHTGGSSRENEDVLVPDAPDTPEGDAEVLGDAANAQKSYDEFIEELGEAAADTDSGEQPDGEEAQAEDSAEDESDDEGSNGDAASGPSTLNSPDVPEEDFRYSDLDTPAEVLLVHYLLGPTRAHYTNITSQIPPVTNAAMCYILQWGDLQTSLAAWWEHNRPYDKTPLLAGLVKFSATEMQWNQASAPPMSVPDEEIQRLRNKIF